MDYKLLDKDLEMMKPYLLKWFREYNILLLESNYRIDKYKVLIDGFAMNPKNLICQGYIYAIENAFREVVKSYNYSVSANLIEKQFLEEGEEGWSNYWKYEMKNYYCRNIIPQIFSILDYISVMINELSEQGFKLKANQVSFNALRKKLRKKDSAIGFLSHEDIENIKSIFPIVSNNITDEEDEILWISGNRYNPEEVNYRNKSIHRYFIGIDELSVNIHRKSLTEQDKLLIESKDGHKFSVKFKPEYSYEKLISIIEKLINNLDLMISKLMELDIMRDVIKPKELT